MNKLVDIALPKWPTLLVVGDNVTEDQAIEINFRTMDRWFSTNDKDFLEDFCELIGAEYHEFYMSVSDELSKKLKLIDGLDYIANSNVMSSWIGGCHGWCSWSGVILANNYNIGKWPEVEEVLNEWQLIAKEFPFLKLKSQLLSGETCEPDAKPLVQFNVSNGTVQLVEPIEKLIPVRDNATDLFISQMNYEFREHLPFYRVRQLWDRYYANVVVK